MINLICPHPPNLSLFSSVAETINFYFIRLVPESQKTVGSKSHKINHPQLIQLVMLGVAQTGARVGGGLGHQPILRAQTSVLNVAMNHVTCALDRVTDHG